MDDITEEENSFVVSGIVHTTRNMGGIIFFNLIDGLRNIPCCIEKSNSQYMILSHLQRGCYLKVLLSDEQGQDNDKQAKKVHKVIEHKRLISKDTPYHDKRYDIELSLIEYAIHEYEYSKSFLNAAVPHILPGLIKSDCFSLSFFNKNARLTSSNALYLDCLACMYSKIYSIHPVFRAEPSHTRMHLSEFLMWEHAELNVSLTELRNHLEQAIKSVIRQVCLKLSLSHPFDLDKPFHTVEYSNLKKSQASFNFSSYEKSYTGDLPMFVLNLPKGIASWRAESSTLGYTKSFNLLMPGIGEVAEGSIRSVSYEQLHTKFEAANQMNNLEWMLRFARFENISVGNFGVGVERLVMSIFNISNIRKIKTFYRDYRFSETRQK